MTVTGFTVRTSRSTRRSCSATSSKPSKSASPPACRRTISARGGARQGESGLAWSFLGAALASTTLPFGVVNAPGQRYHPAIIGQAIVTLAQMFPGRFWAALGSGVASNERVTGDVWPRKEVRDQRLVECVTIIRRLLHGEEVSHEGLVHVNRARLWTLPEIVPDLVGPAVTPETAARHAVNQPRDTLQHSASM